MTEGNVDAFLSLRCVTKRFAAAAVVDTVTLDVLRGRFLTLLGPSGSGKTTLLMMVAGFIPPTEGAIVLNGRDITRTAPEKRNFGMVFQGYALFPHLTVEENVAFSLSVRGRPASEIRTRVGRVLDLVQMAHLGSRLPKQLSGGQQQRVAIARALAFDPDLLLLDEPLSALDKKLRLEMQEELGSLHRRLGTTFVCVTHDQEEALSLSDEVAVMRDGKVVQVAPPSTLYNAPRSRFVADFLGCGNFLEGVVTELAAGHLGYRCGGETFLHAPASPRLRVGDPVTMALRPEHIRIGREPETGWPNAVRGEVASSSFTGLRHQVRVGLASGASLAVSVPANGRDMPLSPGALVWLGWEPRATVMVDDD